MTWNSTGIMSGLPYLDSELTNRNIDICGISEHWLLPENSCILNSFNINYCSSVVTSVTHRLNNRRIGKGGVAFLWHKRLNAAIETFEMNDRIIVLKLSLPNSNLYVIQVYLPTTRYPLSVFKDYVDKNS